MNQFPFMITLTLSYNDVEYSVNKIKSHATGSMRLHFVTTSWNMKKKIDNYWLSCVSFQFYFDSLVSRLLKSVAALWGSFVREPGIKPGHEGHPTYFRQDQEHIWDLWEVNKYSSDLLRRTKCLVCIKCLGDHSDSEGVIEIKNTGQGENIRKVSGTRLK